MEQSAPDATDSRAGPRLTPRVKKAIGIPVLLFGVLAYAGAAMALAVNFVPENFFAQLLYYPVAGVAWAFPAKYLVLWMNRP